MPDATERLGAALATAGALTCRHYLPTACGVDPALSGVLVEFRRLEDGQAFCDALVVQGPARNRRPARQSPLSAGPKPPLALLPGQDTLDNVLAMFRHLAGRERTPGEAEEARRETEVGGPDAGGPIPRASPAAALGARACSGGDP
jgi:hypothetical protein